MPNSAVVRARRARERRAPPSASCARTARATRAGVAPAGDALVERHRDVDAERFLDRDRVLRARGVPARPSTCERKLDALVVDAHAASPRLNTWKPPLSVRIGPSQPMNACRPPSAAHRLDAGTQRQVVRVGEHDLRAELARARAACMPFTAPASRPA